MISKEGLKRNLGLFFLFLKGEKENGTLDY